MLSTKGDKLKDKLNIIRNKRLSFESLDAQTEQLHPITGTP